MNERKEQEKIRKIREYILKSGFPCEIEIGNILRKNGWLVGNQWPYIDKVSQKIRPIDVLAMKMRMQQPALGVLLVIECKKAEKHDWVFHTQQKEKEFLPFMGTIFDLLTKLKNPSLTEKLQQLIPTAVLGDFFGLKTSSSKLLNKLSGLHILDRATRIGICSVVPTSKDDFFEATQQIISALESMAERMKLFIVFPVIVFDGEIFEFYKENEEMKVLPIEHVQFISFKTDMSPCLIDVVRRTHFSKFLEKAEIDFKILSEIVEYKGENP